MNHLAHLALAEEELLIGSFLGDYVKGRLKGNLPAHIEQGVAFHRAVDAYTDQHPVVRRSSARFEISYRRYAGIMIDVIYDYLLANSWHSYYEEPLERFSRRTLEKLLDGKTDLTDAAHQMAQRMQQHNALAHYGTEAFLENAFASLNRRLTRANPLDSAYIEFLKHREALSEDFSLFYPDIIDFCENWKQAR